MPLPNDKYRISLWLIPGEEINTAYGRITFKVWCGKECERLSQTGDSVRVCKNEEGLIALFRLNSAGRARDWDQQLKNVDRSLSRKKLNIIISALLIEVVLASV